MDSEKEILIDTSKMNKGQKDALEVAEQARESEWKHPSFGKQLFAGKYDAKMMEDFPQPSHEECFQLLYFKEDVAAILKKLDPELVDETRTIPENIVNELKELGVFAMKVPKEYGGLGFTQFQYNAIMGLIASHCGSTAVLVSAHQSIGVPQPLKMFGTDEQKKKWLPEFRKGAVSAFALTEPGVGSDPAKLATVATPSEDGSHFLINGEKLWCTNGPIADILVVMARTPDKVVKGKSRQQITAFVVTKDMPGIETVHRCDFMGIRGIQNGLLKFTNVKVPKENIILGEGQGLKLALTTLNTGRLTLPAACAGIGRQCLAIARNWGKKREQWGSPVGKHEAGASKLGDIVATTFAMEAITQLTSLWADDKNKDIRLEAAMAKLFCSVSGWRVVDETVQLRGGRGYEKASSLKARGEDPWPVERMLRDMRINRIIEGTDEIMKLFIARESMDMHLQKAGALLMPKVPLMEKMKTAVKAVGFYSWWLPAQYLPSFKSFFRKNKDLSTYHQYIEKTSKKLARTLFLSIVLNGPKLEKRQMLLGRLVDIGTELFAMATTCNYAESFKNTMDARHYNDAVYLAEVFCKQSFNRINNLFKELSRNDDKTNNDVAKRVLNDELVWLEDGTIKLENIVP